MVHLLPLAEHATGVVATVELGQRMHVLARELRVVIDERFLALDAKLFEQVPQLDHIGERAALVIRVLGEVTVQGLLGFVQELVKAAHRGIPGVFGHPGLDLLEDREIALVHLGVRLVAERPDQHAPERVQVQPHHDVRMCAGEIEHCARLGRAAGVQARTLLLPLGRPAIRKVAVEVVGVVGQEMRRRDGATVEICDVPLGVEPEERTGIFRRARRHHGRPENLAIVAPQFDQFAVGIELAHVSGKAVAIDVGRFPTRVAAVDAVVGWRGAHVSAALEDLLGAVRRDPGHHIEQRLANRLCHVCGQGLAAGLVAAPMDREDVFGDRQCDARAAELAGVHVAVDPDRRTPLLRFAPDDEQRDVPARGAMA